VRDGIPSAYRPVFVQVAAGSLPIEKEKQNIPRMGIVVPDPLPNGDAERPDDASSTSGHARWVRKTMSQSGEQHNAGAITRIDPPHALEASNALHAELPAASECVDAEVLAWTPHAAEQLELQARQLADHLRGRLRDLDQRESVLNSRAAALETEQRTNRLWLNERSAELAEREASLKQREYELELRERDIATEEAATGEERQRQLQELRIRAEEMTRREEALAEGLRRLASQTEAARLEKERQIAAHAEAASALNRRNGELESRLKYLAEAETILGQERQRLAVEKTELAARQIMLRKAIDDEQQLANARKRQLLDEWESAQAALATQRNRLEQREEAVHQLRTDAAHMLRAAMEARLEAEQLWVRLANSMPAAEITRAQCDLRMQQADQHQRCMSEMRHEQLNASELLLQLDARAAALREQRQALEEWHHAARKEADEREQLLIACMAGINPSAQVPLKPSHPTDANTLPLADHIAADHTNADRPASATRARAA
jgi:hypothetical protein